MVQKSFLKAAPSKKHLLQFQFANEPAITKFLAKLKESEDETLQEAAKLSRLVSAEGEIFRLYVGSSKMMEGSREAVTEIFDKQASNSASSVTMRAYRDGEWTIIREQKRRT